MSSLDDQLRALEQQHGKSDPEPASPTDDLDDQLAVIATQFQQKPTPSPKPEPAVIPVNDDLSQMLQALEHDQVSQQLKRSQKNQEICHAIADVIEAKRQQRNSIDAAQNARAIAAEEKKKQQEQKRVREKAENWLKNLEPMSNEGLWFYEFAESYESPLAAAMDYLMALE